jgi:hypothetical protein
MRLTRVKRSRPTAQKTFAGLYARVLVAITRAAEFAAGMKNSWEGPAREVHAAGEASNVSAAATRDSISAQSAGLGDNEAVAGCSDRRA